jgi:hypothetical protein
MHTPGARTHKHTPALRGKGQGAVAKLLPRSAHLLHVLNRLLWILPARIRKEVAHRVLVRSLP